MFLIVVNFNYVDVTTLLLLLLIYWLMMELIKNIHYSVSTLIHINRARTPGDRNAFYM